VKLHLHGLMAIMAGFVAVGAGCEGKPIELTYNRDALYKIPGQIHKLGIAEFAGATPNDHVWGAMVSDKLASGLNEVNELFHRYELVDRARLKGIMDERDTQIMVADPSQAVKLGQLAKTDAMVFGTVRTVCRDEHLTRSQYDYNLKRNIQVPYTRRSCTATVSFFMDDIANGKVIVADQSERKFNSDDTNGDTGKAFLRAMGAAGDDNLPPPDQILGDLIGQCVTDFIAKISPHQIHVKEKLDSGKSGSVSDGNKLALAGEYKDALECYKDGIKEKPDDVGAVFNAGLACEAMGNLEEAVKYYDKAYQMKKGETKYIAARKRVRAELAASTPHPVSTDAPPPPAPMPPGSVVSPGSPGAPAPK
jgi:hypothetical protein